MQHIEAGTQVKGSWNNNVYNLIKKIGRGSFGEVFLAHTDRGEQLVLKFSRHAISITKEYRLLAKLNQDRQLRKLRAIPKVIDADDWTLQDNLYRFIALEYLEGDVLSSFLQQKISLAEAELKEICSSLGEILLCLHRRRLVLGDLKPGNIIYRPGEPLKIIDFGGVTKWGFGVEEYTPLFDRQSWGMGDRTANPGYDIFACGMLLILLGSGSWHFNPADGSQALAKQLTGLDWSEQFKQAVWLALHGWYSDFETFIQELNCDKINLSGRKMHLQ